MQLLGNHGTREKVRAYDYQCAACGLRIWLPERILRRSGRYLLAADFPGQRACESSLPWAAANK